MEMAVGVLVCLFTCFNLDSGSQEERGKREKVARLIYP